MSSFATTRPLTKEFGGVPGRFGQSICLVASAFGIRKEQAFRVKNPSEHRMMVVLAHEILAIQSERGFSGGLIWFRMWEVGSPELIKPGWKIIESMRRAQGDLLAS